MAGAANRAQNESTDQYAKIILWIVSVLVSINISLVGYVAIRQYSMDLRLTTIEANRWTARDGANVFKEIAEINQKLARLPSEYPPIWLREFVAENRNRITSLEARAKHE